MDTPRQCVIFANDPHVCRKPNVQLLRNRHYDIRTENAWLRGQHFKKQGRVEEATGWLAVGILILLDFLFLFRWVVAITAATSQGPQGDRKGLRRLPSHHTAMRVLALHVPTSSWGRHCSGFARSNRCGCFNTHFPNDAQWGASFHMPVCHL